MMRVLGFHCGWIQLLSLSLSLSLLLLLFPLASDCFSTSTRTKRNVVHGNALHRSPSTVASNEAALRRAAASALLMSSGDDPEGSDGEQDPVAPSSLSSSSSPREYTVTLHYEQRSCEILARSDETLLSALERNQASLQSLGLPNSMIPSDCRRGNCLTCTGTLVEGTGEGTESAWISDGDGLSPHISRTVRERGYLLTCSTRVVGEGLQLALGQNHAVWKDIYRDRLDTEPTREEKWAAMASAKRRSDERNQAQWKEATRALLSDE